MVLLTATERKQLDEDGYLTLERVVEPNRVKAMRVRLEDLLAVIPQSHRGTLIVAGLLDDEIFDAAWLHPRILAAVGHVLGDEYRMLGVASRGIRPGHGQQALHVDWGNNGVPGVWYMCHAICALVDFTRENGATRVVPGSHRNPWMLKSRHDPRKPHPAQRQLIGSAGTVFILNVHCGHSAVHNSTGESRLALFSDFSRRDSPLLLNGGIPVADPSPATLARFDSSVQSLLKG